VDSIFATLLGFNELNIFGEDIKTLNNDVKFVTGNPFVNACDEPKTEHSKSKVLIGITLNMREVITGLRMATSTGVGIVFTRKCEDSSSVSNRPSRKPNTVDGLNETISSDLYVMNVRNDTKVGIGKQLNVGFDMDSAVIKFIADVCGKSMKKSGEDTVPSIEMKLPLGILFRTPAVSDSNPFKNRSLSLVGTSQSTQRLTDNTESAEFRHG